MVGWLGGWLVGWLGGWLIGWLVGWLVGWFKLLDELKYIGQIVIGLQPNLWRT